MIDVNKIGLDSSVSQSTQQKVNSQNYENLQKEKLNSEIQRELTSKSDRKVAEQEAKSEFLKYGTSDGRNITSEKEAEKLAHNYVKNEYNKERSQNTQVFMDKSAYKAAEKERKAQRKELIEHYRGLGLSRRDAKKIADSKLTENEYVKGKRTREYVQEHRNDFYDENGNFSSDKFKAKAVEFANTHTIEGETENYYLSLKERRQVAQDQGVKANVIKNIAKKSNIGYERDNTNLYRGLAVVGGTALGVAAAPLFANSAAAAAAASSSSSAAAAGGGASSSASSSASAAAAAAAKSNSYFVGAGIGLGLGLSAAALIKDRGNKEDRVYEPGQPAVPPHKPQAVEPDVMPVQPVKKEEPATPTTTTVKDCPEERWESEYCDYAVRKGDYWASVIQGKMTVNGKRPDGKVLKALIHAEKLKHGITNFKLNTMPSVGQNMRLYTDFSDLIENEQYIKKYPELKYLDDAMIQIDCDGKVLKRNSSSNPRYKFVRWNGSPVETNKYKQDCNDNVPVRLN